MGQPLNVIVVMLDSLTLRGLGCFGGKNVNTDYIDRFAAGATLFDRAYVGSYPTAPARHDAWTGIYDFPKRTWGPVLPEDVTFPRLLGENGVPSMWIGDTYVMTDASYSVQKGYTDVAFPHLPGNYQSCFTGWHLVRGWQSDRWWPTDREGFKFADPKKYRGEETSRMKLFLQQTARQHYEKDYQTAQVCQAAMDWLQDNARRSTPFALWVDIFHPHEPFLPPPHYLRLYEKEPLDPPLIFPRYTWEDKVFSDREVEHIAAQFKAEVTFADRWIGRLFQTIDDLEMTDRSLVILLSDHGFFTGERPGVVGKAGMLYETIARVPLIVRHPEGENRGERRDDLVTIADLFPTILEATGTPVPEGIDGLSLIGPTLGKPNGRQWHAYGAHGGTTGITDEKHTLLLLGKGNKKKWAELYRNADGFMLLKNVLKEEPAAAAALKKKLLDFMAAHGATEEYLRPYAEVPVE